MKFVCFFCVCRHVRNDLIEGDFPSNMKLLQNYPQSDVRGILILANTFANT